MRKIISPLGGFRSPFGIKSGAAPSPPVSARYWRLFINSPVGGTSDYSEISELEMFTLIGGSDVTTGGTPIASSAFGGSVAANAFDGTKPGGSVWISGAASAPQWIGYDFGAGNPQAIVAIAISISGSTGRAPRDFQVEYSADGSTWLSANWVVTGQIDWTGSQTRTYTKPTGPSDPKRMWRLNVTDTVSSGDYVQIAELEFNVNGAGAPRSGFILGGSGYFGTAFPSFAFDGSTGGTNWISPNQTKPHWIGYDYGVGRNVNSVTITATDGNRAPKNFDIQYSQDGITWTTEWSVAGATWPSATQTFTKPDSAGASRYWRVYITDNNGDAVNTIHELQMYTAAGAISVCSGGTAIESGHDSSAAADNLFDGNVGTDWSKTGLPAWVGYDFGDGNEKAIIGVAMFPPASPYVNRMPKDFDVQYSNDGISWATSWSVQDSTDWTEKVGREFYSTAQDLYNSTFRYWRILATARDGGGRYTIHELEMMAEVGGATVAAGGSALASSNEGGQPPSNAFDGNTSTSWSDGTTGTYEFLGYDFGAGNEKNIKSVSILAAGAGYNDRTPTSFRIQRSADGLMWIDKWAVSGSTAWEASEKRTFNAP